MLLPLSYSRMSPSPVPIRATRPYRGPADAGPKGVSWGSAIRTRTNSFRDYRAACYPIPHRPPWSQGSVRSAGLEPALSTSSTWPLFRWSTSAEPSSGADPDRRPYGGRVTAVCDGGPPGGQARRTARGLQGRPRTGPRAEGAIRTRKPRGLSSRGIPVPVTPASCAARDSNPEPSA
jgi:hypothetical protein